MLTSEELFTKHSIYLSAQDNLYKRERGGASEFGLRTEDIFGDNIYMFPERYIPSRANKTGKENKHIIYNTIDGKVCVCGCALCNNLYVMRHVESGQELAVGSSCITKAKGHLYKKYDSYNEEIEPIKKEYNNFDNYLKDLGKRRCSNCYDLVYAHNRKPNKKNITEKDYVNTSMPPYCYKCDEKYIKNPKCINCNDILVCDITCDYEQSINKVCSGCSNSNLKFYLNISYADKDKYKKYKTKWDSSVKKWYVITSLKTLNDCLKKLVDSIVKQ